MIGVNMKKIRTGKQNRHEKITVALLSGKPTSPDEIKALFKGTDQEAVLYRLSTNIYNIRRDGGIIRVTKNGRAVAGYQLMNPQDFNSEGRFVGRKYVETTTTPEVNVETTNELETV
jgi:hypothetical protein